MKPLQNISFIIFLSFLISSIGSSQVFNVEDYKDFLETHQNMNTEDLLQLHPAGTFTANINQNYNEALYFDSIDAFFDFTEYEKSLIEDNGFMVSERLSKISFGQSILEIFHNDLPVFVSTDAILHALHISYDRILRDMEEGLLLDRVTELLTGLRNSISQLNAKYSAYPEMLTMLKDVDVYVTVPLLLLEENVTPYYPDNAGIIDTILNWIEDEQGHVLSTVFSSTCRTMDWSQFKPRGHYVFDPNEPGAVNLEPYFRTMMWLGRVELYLLKPRTIPFPCDSQTVADIRRQTIDAFLIDELFDIAGVEPIQQEIETVLKFFVGESDNVTLDNLDYLKQAISLDSASQLLDYTYLSIFQDTLKNQAFAYQLILSQILYNSFANPDSIIPASAFLMFGQRFVIDSYVTGSVVFDKIVYNGLRVCRLFPSTLDVLFALGNDASAQLLIEELDEYHYSTNLAALRYLIDHYNPDFWQSTIYNAWLNSIRTLNPPLDRANLPEFMQTAAYWQQKMNTQLTSWAQLRHDNLLYAKQSYTGGTVCSYPYSFVEPFPEFFSTLNTLSEDAANYFSTLSFLDPIIKSEIISYFNHFKTTMDTLESISYKELQGEQFTPEEILFLQTMLYDVTSSGDPFRGWYPKLYYNDMFRGLEGYEGLMESDYLVADIHTVPTDCGGNVVGWIPHVGTGKINTAVVLAENHEGNLTAFAGPVFSYFEHVTDEFYRLTDGEWEETYLQLAQRPEWVNIYLADTLGETRGSGPTLITNVSYDENQTIPQSQILLNNYPNPFNPFTIIAFTIPYDLTNSFVELKIYDVQGSLVKSLVSENLSAGNYLVNWNADDNSGIKTASGVYIYSLRVGDRMETRKMTLLK